MISSSRGVQQGDPLGPLYFCCGISVLVEKIQRFAPRYNKWYMDDGGICGSEEKLVQIWHMLLEESPKLGLELNPSKCEWSWMDPKCKKPCPISVPGGAEKQLTLVPTDEIHWGFPWDLMRRLQRIEKKLLHKLSVMVERLSDFDDMQSAFFLLRTSFSIVRATHFMRTTPLAKWRKQAKRFDKEIWELRVSWV